MAEPRNLFAPVAADPLAAVLQAIDVTREEVLAGREETQAGFGEMRKMYSALASRVDGVESTVEDHGASIQLLQEQVAAIAASDRPQTIFGYLRGV
jgi:hypothetical protein